MSNGTYDDVIQVSKTDASGQEATATDIAEYGGALWSNLVDDSIQRVVEMYDRGTKVWLVADATERDALGSDDNLAEADLCFQIDTLGINYCVSVDGASSSTWDPVAATGNVAGPGLSTDHAVARWDGAGGATLQNSVVVISDAGAITGVASIAVSGNVDGRDVSADGAALDAHIANISNPHSTLLSQVLAAGATTQSNDIEVTNGDSIVGEDGGAITFAAGTGVIGLTETSVTGDLSVSGKLSVVGLIDPSGLVLDEQVASPYTAAGKTTIWTKNTIPTTLWYTDDAGNDAQVAPTTSFALASVLVFGSTTGGTDITCTSGDKILGETGVGSPGGAVEILAGTGSANEVGGAASLTAGTGGDTAAGGSALVSGGSGGTTSGAGGTTTVQGGSASAGNSNGGGLELASGQASGSGNPGDISITASDAISGNVEGGLVAIAAGVGVGSGGGGPITVTSGDAGIGAATGGALTMTAGMGGTTSGTGGMATILGGAGTTNSAGGEMAGFGGAGAGSGAGGQAKIQGGAGGATGNGGAATVRGGAGGATSGTGGAVSMLAGTGTAATATGGAASVTAGAGGSGAATGGAASLTSGAGGGTSGNSGAVNIASGAVTSGTRGTVTIDGGTIVLTAVTDITVTNHSYHSVRGSTARGAVNTQIYRWTSAIDSVGTDITYSDSANSGGSWAINTAGIYSVTCSIDVGHNGYIAIKKAAALSNTFDETSIQNAVEAITGNTVTCSWTGWCSAGDDIWIATSAATNPTGTPVNNARVWVCRIR